ncbi:hypothetical protein ACSYAD_26035 [Acaryochloris marina NIES-2412]|uniref:hypothetical protein n=1 Tax=Acaryochloris marina TaxID=155978 RepID=UPI004057F59F
MNPTNSPDSIPNTEDLPQPRAGKSVLVMGILLNKQLKTTDFNPSGQPPSHSEKRVLEAFKGMMLSCHRIRDTVRETRERTH